ncbi:hypothetical protein [Xanthomonas sp. XNM01]|uniref:hypothetical protein n=1 Tax=Xanthomonas sp. XNM01 TaxID=2769289 RepID=UPI0017853B54|nr:hypothetical protein [Xanthomonas sp. XNM01]
MTAQQRAHICRLAADVEHELRLAAHFDRSGNAVAAAARRADADWNAAIALRIAAGAA